MVFGADLAVFIDLNVAGTAVGPASIAKGCLGGLDVFGADAEHAAIGIKAPSRGHGGICATRLLRLVAEYFKLKTVKVLAQNSVNHTCNRVGSVHRRCAI